MNDQTSPRTIILRGAGLVVLLGAVLLAIELLVPGAGRRLDAADPAWLAIAVVLEGVALAGSVVLFHATFGRRPHGLTLRRSAEIALGELAGFALVPTGAGGPAVRLWALRGGGMPWRDIGVRSVVHGVLFEYRNQASQLALRDLFADCVDLNARSGVDAQSGNRLVGVRVIAHAFQADLGL